MKPVPTIARLPIPGLSSAVCAGIIIILVMVSKVLHVDGNHGSSAISDLGWTISATLALVACAVAAARQHGGARNVWLFMSAASGAWLAGQIAWNYYDATGFPASPNFSDAGFIAFVPCVLCALLFIGRGSRISRLLLLLDLTIVICALTNVFVVIFAAGIQHATISRAGVFSTLSYPILYGTLCLAAFLIPVHQWWRNVSLRLLLLGFICEALPFMLWTPMLLENRVPVGGPLDAVWMLGMLLIAAAAARFERFPSLETEGQIFGAMSAAPIVLTVVSITVRGGTLTVLHVPDMLEPILEWCISALVILNVVRLGLTLRYGRVLFERVREGRRQADTIADALRRSEARFRAIFDHSPVGIEIADRDGNFIDANRAAEAMLGYGPGEITGKHWTEITHADNVAEEDRLDGMLLRREIEGYEIEKRQIRKDGSLIWTHQTIAAVFEDDEPQFGIAMIEDITERRRAEEELLRRERAFRLLFQANPHAMWLYDLDTLQFLEVNDAAVREYGYSREEFLALHLQDIRPPEQVPELLEILQRHRVQPRATVETKHRLKDGTVVDVEVASDRIPFAGHDAVLVLAQNITDRKRTEEALKHQALHDGLTNLPNRVLLRDRLEQAILTARRDASSLAMLLMDLDGFKDVNDTFGHQYGDALLQQVGPRIRSALRESDTVARLGGDEFAVILPATDVPGAIRVVQSLITAFNEPFVVEGRSLHVEASIGIALYPDHGSNADLLLRRADVAMYVAKRSGYDERYRVYSPDHDAHTPEKLALIGDLRLAIERDELFLEYQPKINLGDGCAEHVEALVRWTHPVRGRINPDQFIGLAEETGLIGQLTLWVLRAALQQCRRWHDAGIDMNIAVNLSTRNLRDPLLPAQIRRMLKEIQLPPSALTIEITESLLMADPAEAMQLLSDLHETGVQIAVDDFGTGYSSLAYLKRLPVDDIKIDRSFVTDMATNESDRTIVRSVIDLGHNLGLQVVAEGVEDLTTLEDLTRMGCDEAQGYYISRPLSAEAFTTWVQARHLEASA